MTQTKYLSDEEVITRRWKKGIANLSDYYYDEAPPSTPLSASSKPEDFPPNGLDLSDVWTVSIVGSSLTDVERYRRWPVNFTSKGGLRQSYVYKGEPALFATEPEEEKKYFLVLGTYHMFGAEGVDWAPTLLREKTILSPRPKQK